MGLVTIIAMRICAARLDTRVTHEDFVQLVARFADVVVAEALENAGPLPHLRVNAGDRVPAGIVDAWRDNSSTGAARAETKAGQTLTSTAAETPAAPCTNATSEPQQSPGAELSKVSRSYTADNDHSKTVAADETPRAPSSPTIDRSKIRGRRPALPEDLRQRVREACAIAMRDNGGERVPYGWAMKAAQEFGISRSALGRLIADVKPAAPLPRQQAVAHVRDDEDDDPPPAPPQRREHTNSHSCWCRSKPAGVANVWCKIDKPQKPIGNLAGLQEQRPRRERYFEERG